ncbi:hypothetical protein GCM10023090_08820 [Acidovorax lacteus]|uniref:Uncharacterized protein n=1 Tax=Acidovorax lacteus TaxID=1924988 RepID=A0ABP8L224_9BURK
MARGNAVDALVDGLEAGQELLDTKGAEGVAAFKLGNVQGHGGGLWQEGTKVDRVAAGRMVRSLNGTCAWGTQRGLVQPAILPGWHSGLAVGRVRPAAARCGACLRQRQGSTAAPHARAAPMG